MVFGVTVPLPLFSSLNPGGVQRAQAEQRRADALAEATLRATQVELQQAVNAVQINAERVAYIEREYDSGYYYYNEQSSEPTEEEEDGPTTRFGLRTAAGEQRVEVDLEGIVPTTVHWTPSGARVVLHDDQEGRLELRDGTSGELVARIEPDDGVLWDVPVFRPNGGAMATVGSDGALRIRAAISRIRSLPSVVSSAVSPTKSLRCRMKSAASPLVCMTWKCSRITLPSG